jgi:hypothetical protein
MRCLAVSAVFSIGALANVSCIGNCGTGFANGDVNPAPGFSSYSYVSTFGGVIGAGIIPTGAIGGETDGSLLTSGLFSASANSALSFNFNYITSDGTVTFPDYGWAALENASGNLVALLFTAQTTPTGNTSPGFGLPIPAATLNPVSTVIQHGSGASGCATTPCTFPSGGGPVWSYLGPSAGACYADGCGLTGWINASYTIQNAGTYQLAFGVVNYTDQAFDSGLAIDGAQVNGVPVDVEDTPEPSYLVALGLGLSAMAAAVWRRR